MFLQYVRLKNFRGFADNELSFVEVDDENDEEFSRKTTILLGKNGTGKSNLLKAIGLVVAGRSALAELLGDVDSWVQYRKKFCRIDAVLETKAGDRREISLRIDRGKKRHEVLDKNLESLDALDSALEHTDRSYFTLGYGASRRLDYGEIRVKRRGSLYSERRAQGMASLFEPGSLLAPIESWAMDLDYRKDRGALEVIRKVFSQILGEVKFEKIDKANGQLLFRTPDGIVPMSYLSDGYQSVAAWIGDLLFRVTDSFADYTKPLHTRGLLLIDEVDLHLHPIWQRKLLEFLRTKLPNMQVVATTHSPITAQQAGPRELHFIERRGKSLNLQQFAGAPQDLLLHQLVMSDAFGLDSDESAEIEGKKRRLSRLSGLKRRTAVQEKEHRELVKELEGVPVRLRTNAKATDEQIALLQQIQKELQGN